jgi:hypothetical protein
VASAVGGGFSLMLMTNGQGHLSRPAGADAPFRAFPIVDHLPRDAEIFGKGRPPPISVQDEAKSDNIGVRKGLKVILLSNRYGFRQLWRLMRLPFRIFLKTLVVVKTLMRRI